MFLCDFNFILPLYNKFFHLSMKMDFVFLVCTYEIQFLNPLITLQFTLRAFFIDESFDQSGAISRHVFLP